MEILAVVFAIGIILALFLLPNAVKDYNDAEWFSEMGKRLMPAVREEVERENLGNSLRTEE